MLTQMHVFSSQPNAPELQLGGFIANDDSIQILDVAGLDPVKADLVSIPSATGRGDLPQGATTGKRNIVLTLGMNPNWEEQQTITSLRQQLYAYFMPEQKVKLRFFSDYLPTVDIEGFVESFEANMFSQAPEIQISILCYKPDFVAAYATVRTGILQSGELDTFYYPGTVPTGFELKIEPTVDNPDYLGIIQVINQSPVDVQMFEAVGLRVNDGKYFDLSTVRHSKYAHNVLVADETVINLMSQVTKASVWPEFKPGDNTFSIIAAESGQEWTLTYFNRFGGL